MQAKKSDEAAGGGRQKNTDVFLARRQGGEPAAQNEARHHDTAIGQRGALDILEHLMVPAMDVARGDERLEQGLIDETGAEHHVGHDVIKPVGEEFAQFGALEMRRRLGLDRGKEGQGDLGKPAQPQLALHQREGRVLRAVDADRQDPGPGQVRDDARPLIDLHQRAGAGDPAFREYDDLAPALQATGERLERHRIGGIDGQQVEQLESGLHPPAVGDMGVDGEMAAFRQEGRDQRPVEERSVIGDDERLAARLGKILEALDLDPVQEAE